MRVALRPTIKRYLQELHDASLIDNEDDDKFNVLCNNSQEKDVCSPTSMTNILTENIALNPSIIKCKHLSFDTIKNDTQKNNNPPLFKKCNSYDNTCS